MLYLSRGCESLSHSRCRTQNCIRTWPAQQTHRRIQCPRKSLRNYQGLQCFPSAEDIRHRRLDQWINYTDGDEEDNYFEDGEYRYEEEDVSRGLLHDLYFGEEDDVGDGEEDGDGSDYLGDECFSGVDIELVPWMGYEGT